jgi:uncharacterized Zn finger protein (UPF0148 family)
MDGEETKEMNEDNIIEYPNPTCDRCKTKMYLMFYQGKVECSNCHEIIWECGARRKDSKK